MNEKQDWESMERELEKLHAQALFQDFRKGLDICKSVDEFDGTNAAEIRTAIADEREQLLGNTQPLLEPYRLSLLVRYKPQLDDWGSDFRERPLSKRLPLSNRKWPFPFASNCSSTH